MPCELYLRFISLGNRSKTLTRLASYASNGSLHQAKYATTILCNSKDPEATCTDLLEVRQIGVVIKMYFAYHLTN
jgi:hypothetical protein